jgi:O-antigen/teichoic acid export membrane protein
MGICSTVTREISANLHINQKYIRDFIQTASLFFWSVYVLLAIGIIIGAPFIIGKWVNLATIDTATAIKVLQIMGAGILIGIPISLYSSLLAGLQRMEFTNSIDVSSMALRQIGIIVIINLGGGLITVAWWFALCFIIDLLAYFCVCAKFFSWQSLVPRYSLYVIQQNGKYISRMIPLSILGMVHTESDKAIASKLLSIGTFGYYSFSSNIARAGTVLANVVSQTAFPSFSALFKLGDRVNLSRQYRKLQDLVCFGGIPIFAGIIFFASPLFAYVFNEEISHSLIFPTAILVVGFWMNTTLGVPYFFSLACGKPGISVRSNFFALLFVLPILLLIVYFFGLNGVSFSWILYSLFSYIYFIPRVCSQCLLISSKSWFFHILKVITLAIIIYGVEWTIIMIFDIYLIPFLLLLYALATAIFLVSAYFMIGKDLKETIKEFKKTLFQKLKIDIA